MSESAFPTHQQTRQDGEVLQWGEPGMSLRDYFAAKAMTAIASRGHVPDLECMALTSYQMADAMLKVRSS